MGECLPHDHPITNALLSMSSQDHSEGASSQDAIPMLADGVGVLRLPLSTIRGHVIHCKRVAGLQTEMVPPGPIRKEGVGSLHMTVYAADRQTAVDVVRMLVFCHVPFVSVFEP
jgi:hypothetical protein